MRKQQATSILIAVILILAAAFSRVIMYPDNFSPIIGMAIFSGAVIKDKRLAFAMPLFSMFLSDLMFEFFTSAQGFYGWGQLLNYAIFPLITVIAFSLKKHTPLRIGAYALGSSLIFFILSNLSFFIFDNPVYHTYTQDWSGFITCYVKALPFFRTSLIADLVYSFVLFGAYHLANKAVESKEMVSKSV